MDRYAGIRDPLRRRVERRAPIGLRIGVVWLISAAIGSPLVALGAVSPDEVLSVDLQCAIFNEYFLVYGSLAAFFGPLCVMLITFALTVRLLRRQGQHLGLFASATDGGMRRWKPQRQRRTRSKHASAGKLPNLMAFRAMTESTTAMIRTADGKLDQRQSFVDRLEKRCRRTLSKMASGSVRKRGRSGADCDRRRWSAAADDESVELNDVSTMSAGVTNTTTSAAGDARESTFSARPTAIKSATRADRDIDGGMTSLDKTNSSMAVIQSPDCTDDGEHGHDCGRPEQMPKISVQLSYGDDLRKADPAEMPPTYRLDVADDDGFVATGCDQCDQQQRPSHLEVVVDEPCEGLSVTPLKRKSFSMQEPALCSILAPDSDKLRSKQQRGKRRDEGDCGGGSGSGSVFGRSAAATKKKLRRFASFVLRRSDSESARYGTRSNAARRDAVVITTYGFHGDDNSCCSTSTYSDSDDSDNRFRYFRPSFSSLSSELSPFTPEEETGADGQHGGKAQSPQPTVGEIVERCEQTDTSTANCPTDPPTSAVRATASDIAGGRRSSQSPGGAFLSLPTTTTPVQVDSVPVCVLSFSNLAADSNSKTDAVRPALEPALSGRSDVETDAAAAELPKDLSAVPPPNDAKLHRFSGTLSVNDVSAPHARRGSTPLSSSSFPDVELRCQLLVARSHRRHSRPNTPSFSAQQQPQQRHSLLSTANCSLLSETCRIRSLDRCVSTDRRRRRSMTTSPLSNSTPLRCLETTHLSPDESPKTFRGDGTIDRQTDDVPTGEAAAADAGPVTSSQQPRSVAADDGQQYSSGQRVDDGTVGESLETAAQVVIGNNSSMSPSVDSLAAFEGDEMMMMMWRGELGRGANGRGQRPAATANGDVAYIDVNRHLADSSGNRTSSVTTLTEGASTTSGAASVTACGNYSASHPAIIGGRIRFKSLVKKHGPAFQVVGVLRETREKQQKKAFNSVKTERKAVRVLGTMFAIFFACWAPFFTANLVMGLCRECQINGMLFKVRL
jgi:hypothetical protein